ncbi:MAG: glycosyltransferase [Candidatus Abyssobacteria bacterium SURF_5]|uniref:Glycosyltransferase n=1 Tax=Abyssobacteria bacterium (strain SURF_5) TaxID=2093360 RepID=A0A3A4NNC8_ABYX5|nr:MAG: glycosyltransferase [Candidatus Abyssubacteria bacterium SURF_5]
MKSARKPTVHILYEFVDGPWGGANQFLRALRERLRRMEVYEEDPQEADIIIFNSNPANCEARGTECFKYRRFFKKTIINRVGGPILLARGSDFLMDKAIYLFNSSFCDGTIFQSSRSMQENLKLGMRPKPQVVVIPNAPDPAIFHPATSRLPRQNERIRLITTSWSPNMRKGFDILQFLDDNLDFQKYILSFYGNSPVQFRNIKMFSSVSSRELADILRSQDIYLATSVYEACSNSLLEALHCGIPAVARIGGADRELVGEGGILFTDQTDVIEAIEAVAQNLETFRKNIKPVHLQEVSERYYEFCRRTHETTCEEKKKARYLDLLHMKAILYKRKATSA